MLRSDKNGALEPRHICHHNIQSPVSGSFLCTQEIFFSFHHAQGYQHVHCTLKQEPVSMITTIAAIFTSVMQSCYLGETGVIMTPG